jgi:hypothetical protein
MEVIKVRTHKATNIDEEFVIDAFDKGRCVFNDDGSQVNYVLDVDVTLPPTTTVTIITGINIRYKDGEHNRCMLLIPKHGPRIHSQQAVPLNSEKAKLEIKIVNSSSFTQVIKSGLPLLVVSVIELDSN